MLSKNTIQIHRFVGSQMQICCFYYDRSGYGFLFLEKYSLPIVEGKSCQTTPKMNVIYGMR